MSLNLEICHVLSFNLFRLNIYQNSWCWNLKAFQLNVYSVLTKDQRTWKIQEHSYIVCRHSFLIIVGLRTLLANLLMTLYGLALCDEMLDHFPLFDETLRHIELCNCVFSQISTKNFLTVYLSKDKGNSNLIVNIQYLKSTLNLLKLQKR